MATYPINFPTRAPASARLTLNRRQSVGESPFTYKQQTVNTASQWVLQWTWPRMTWAKAEAINAWLNSLKGQIGTFLYRPHQPYASALTGRTLAITGFATNEAISVAGFEASAPTTLRPGQFFQIGKQLLQIVEAPVSADASGRATISFEPELRIAYGAGTAVNFAAPVGVFRLSTSDGQGYTLDPDRKPEFGTLQAREAV